MLDMKRRNKFLTFFILLFIAVYLCLPSMESIVKNIVHEYGSAITGTDVSLGGFDLKIQNGEGVVKNIKVGNPREYKSKNLFELKKIGIKVNISSLTDDTIIIDSITIDNPKITYEMLSLKQNNVSDILNNIKANTASTEAKESDDSDKTKQKTGGKSSGKKVIIKELSISNGQIAVMAGLGKAKKEFSLPLPKIVMQNIGQDKKGASVTETLSKVMSEILQVTSKIVLSSDLSGIKDASLKQIQETTDQLKQETEKLKSGAKNLKNNLTGLFKHEKKS